jgi:hypothetical protein
MLGRVLDWKDGGMEGVKDEALTPALRVLYNVW